MAFTRTKWLLAVATGCLLLVHILCLFTLKPHAVASIDLDHADGSSRKLGHSDERSKDLHHFTASHKSNDRSKDLHPFVPSHNSNEWPDAPSQLPWTPRSNLLINSCEGYFGNGFTKQVTVFPPKSTSILKSKLFPFKGANIKMKADNPSLQCFYSETLGTSICEGLKVVMHPGRIHMAAGGEELDSVVGRTDEEELPSFSPGSFEIVVSGNEAPHWAISREVLDVILPQGQIYDHRLRSLFSNIETVSSEDVDCSQTVKSSTLLVIRYEYANLFHTATDWYSSYVASRVLNLPQRPNVVFLDGHCQSPMQDGWEALFRNVTYAKAYKDSVCFDHVIFTPLGYETALFKGLNTGIPCKGCSADELKQAEDGMKTARLREFGEVFKSAFGVVNRRSKRSINILLVRRESYLAHPRHSGQPETRLQNEQELFNAMEQWSRSESQKVGHLWDINIINGTLAHMKMKDQVQAVDDASVIVGVHGAGLTHILFARPGTVVLELLGHTFYRPHYSHISQWMGVSYRTIIMSGTVVNCKEVLVQLSNIVESLAV